MLCETTRTVSFICFPAAVAPQHGLHFLKVSTPKKTLVAAASAVLAIVATLWFSRQSEPAYQGRPLRYWIHLHSVADGTTQQRAAEAIAQIGTNGLPWLLKWLDYRPERWRARLTAARSSRGGKTFHWIPVWATSARGYARADEALSAFEPLGPRAATAIPTLAELAQKRDLDASVRAFLALQFLGPAAIPQLLLIHDDATSNPAVRREAAYALKELLARMVANGELEPSALGSLARLDPDAKSQDFWIVVEVPEITAALRRCPEASVPGLRKALQVRGPCVRVHALVALATFGPKATGARPGISNLLRDPDKAVREAATNAMLRIPENAAERH